MGRNVVLLLVAALAPTAGTVDDPAYRADNARLAHATPHYPRAHILVDETIHGEAGATPFEAVQRIYRLAAPSTQRRVLGFYRRRLGPAWHRKGSACITSGRRAVAVFLYPPRRRLGVVIDSRGASYCREHVANIGLLLQLGYPD